MFSVVPINKYIPETLLTSAIRLLLKVTLVTTSTLLKRAGSMST